MVDRVYTILRTVYNDQNTDFRIYIIDIDSDHILESVHSNTIKIVQRHKKIKCLNG